SVGAVCVPGFGPVVVSQRPAAVQIGSAPRRKQSEPVAGGAGNAVVGGRPGVGPVNAPPAGVVGFGATPAATVGVNGSFCTPETESGSMTGSVSLVVKV